MEKHDITSRQDVQLLIDTFYLHVRKDEVIGFIFNDVAQVDWVKHLPVMYDFWDNVLLDSGTYTRNTMAPHFMLNEKVRLLPEHFSRWIQLFETTVQQLFQGPTADLAITRARSIKGIMEIKMNHVNTKR
jgi:hemoglobin